MSIENGNSDNLVDVQELCKSYGSLQAVDGVSFTVKRGEVFGILGPNGAGKTTTVEILEGMRLPDSGVARINGIDIRKDPRAVKSLIGIQLQSSSFFEKLNLAELLEVFGSLYRRRVDAKALLCEVELEDRARSEFKDLSGGQKQRFSIATTLVNDPLLLFLDEPTTGLDPQARRHLWELVKRFKTEGRTVLMTTHYMEEAEELCDRVAIMDRGRIVAMDPPDRLIDDLLAKGFQKDRVEKQANLEDVFLDLTGRALRDE
jgi:ABC-2 type transport system ATP-binding protein